MVVNWPGTTTEMTPPQTQFTMLESVSAGMLAIITVGIPGAHGAGIRGWQAAGAKTTGGGRMVCGLATDMHMPKGMILTIGLLSMMLAAGGPPTMTKFAGSTAMAAGATPKLHFNKAPAHTRQPI